MRIFIGREEALGALLGDLLGRSPYTIANLHGIGGVGKTTLKAEVLLRLQEAGAMVPVFHADENVARADLAEFIGALAESFYQPWEGDPATFPRVNRTRARLRELKGRLIRERDAALLGRGLEIALSGLARRALLPWRAPGANAPEPILHATIPVRPLGPGMPAGSGAVSAPGEADAPSDGSPRHVARQPDLAQPGAAWQLDPARETAPEGGLGTGSAARMAGGKAAEPGSSAHDKAPTTMAVSADSAKATATTRPYPPTVPAGFTYHAPTSEWSRADQHAYEQAVAAWTRDRDDQELLLDPLQAMTRALFDDLIDYLYPAQSGLLDLLGGHRNLSQAPLRVLIAIDSYEALDAGLHDWLLVHVLPGLRRVHADTGKRVGDLIDLRLLLCGREALRDADPLRRWDTLASSIREIDLGRFGEAEVAAYLQARGLPTSEAARALAETQGLPYLLALWCDSAGAHRAVAVARATSRIYWWKTPEQIRWLKAAAFLDIVDRDRLTVMLANPEEAQEAYAWLASNGEVAAQSAMGGIAVHPIVRDLVQKGLAQESPVEMAELARRAEIASQTATLRASIGPATFDALLLLAPLRWFEPVLLGELFPTEAESLWRAAESLHRSPDGPGRAAESPIRGADESRLAAEGLHHGPNGPGREAGRPDDGPPQRLLPERTEPLLVVPADAPEGALCLAEPVRALLAEYLRLSRPSAYLETLATLREAARRRAEAETLRAESLEDRASSRQADATVARQRSIALEARVASLQADQHAAEARLERAARAVPDPARVSRRAPWWAGAASGLLGAVASFGSLPLLGPGERLIGWSVGAALLVIALACASRALWLPPPPSEQQVDQARRAVDEAEAHLARIRGDLAQALLEVSHAARLADQLQAEADDLAAQALRREPAFV